MSSTTARRSTKRPAWPEHCGAVMVHESLLPSITGALSTAGLAQVEDVRGRDSTWVFNNYGSMLNKNMIFRQMPSFNQQLRSLAVLNTGFVFNNTGATRDTFLAAQNDNSRVFGWGFNGSETEFFGSASQHNLMGVPADHLRGSAASARWEVAIPDQPAHTPVNTPTDPNKHYVAFVMSDGDNVQWLTNDFAREHALVRLAQSRRLRFHVRYESVAGRREPRRTQIFL